MQKVNASNKSGYEALLKVYRETDLSQEKGRIIGKWSHLLVHILRLPSLLINLLFSSVYWFFRWFIGSLASCPDPNIVLEVLNFLLSSEVSYNYRTFWCLILNDAITWSLRKLTVKVRSQDAIFGLSVSKEGRETAWKWLQVI